MTVQITRFSLFQTAKVIGALYFVGAIVGVVLFVLASLVAPSGTAYPLAFVLLAPFLYALFGFVLTFIAAAVYNAVAKVTGGIEFTTAEARRDF